MTHFIEAKALGLSYGVGGQSVHALIDVSFELNSAAQVAVTGPSGSGKSSLLGLLGGFLKPSAGDCFVNGQSLLRMTDAERTHYRSNVLGFIFQQFCLLPHLSLLDNTLLGVDHLRHERKAWTHKARALLERVGLDAEHARFPDEVSGGQAQRAAIARALLRKPQLVLADEPTGSLDSETAADVLTLLKSLCQEGCALVVVTHSPEVAAAMPRRISLQAGRLHSDAMGAVAV